MKRFRAGIIIQYMLYYQHKHIMCWIIQGESEDHFILHLLYIPCTVCHCQILKLFFLTDKFEDLCG